MAQPKAQKNHMGDPFSRFTKWVGSVPSVIVHTILFAAAFLIAAVGVADWDTVLLVVTTLVSLEAIYLAIFIQMSVNRAQESLAEVEEDIDEIQEDIDELGEDIDEIGEDIDEMQEDIDELGEEEDQENISIRKQEVTLEQISGTLQKLIGDLERLKK